MMNGVIKSVLVEASTPLLPMTLRLYLDHYSVLPGSLYQIDILHLIYAEWLKLTGIDTG